MLQVLVKVLAWWIDLNCTRLLEKLDNTIVVTEARTSRQKLFL